MRISLIGMAGAGKSYWSRTLSMHGFAWICCDDLIAQRLGPVLQRPDGRPMEMGAWMGLPDSPGYEEREALYLRTEIEVMEDVLGALAQDDKPGDVVLDTTGSVIYTGEAILGRLRSLTTVVYLETPPEVVNEMLRAYAKAPGPVLWQGLFRKKPGEPTQEALTRCYPELVAYRRKRYVQWASVRIPYDLRRGEGFGAREFLQAVRCALDSQCEAPSAAPKAH